MKLVDAYWDTRNLGVRTAEVTYSYDDLAIVPDCDGFEYVVAKVPSGRIDIVMLLEGVGFHFVEAQITYSLDLKGLEVPHLASRLSSRCSSRLVSDGEVDRVFDEVRDGIFTTDRVALDPAFGLKVAGERYVGWLRDEIARGCELYELCYRDVPVGFYAIAYKGSGLAWPILGGLYRGVNAPGLGICLSIEEARAAESHGCDRIVSAYSSNNMAVAKVWESLGSKTERIDYVLVLHKRILGA